MPDPTNDIEALIEFLATASQEPFYYTATHNAEKYHASLTALVSERDALQAKVKEHAEDRRKYIDAWADWIEANAGLEIDQWLRVYADAVPIPSPDGDEAKQRIFKHLDQRMRDASDAIDALKQRVAELESQPPTSDLRERLVCAALTAIVMAEASYADAAESAVCYADATLAEMRKGDTNA